MIDTTKQKKKMYRTYAISAISIALVFGVIAAAVFAIWYDRSRPDIWVKAMAAIVLGSLVITPLTLRRNYKNFLKPIWIMMDYINSMASGDLTGTLAAHKFGTLDVMKDALVKMRIQVRRLIYEVTTMAGMIDKSSADLAKEVDHTRGVAREVAKAVSDVAQASNEQASAIEDISNETIQIGQIAVRIAEASKNMAGRLIEAQEIASSGAEKIEEQQGHLQANRALIEQINLVVVGLAQKSQEIGVTMDVIKDIAGQTNLLALNASIEAARTGDRGRGFQVVAQQVRKLADESSNAAVETERLVTGIRQSIDQVAGQTMAAQNIVRDQQGIMNDNYQVIEHVTKNMTVIKTETDNLNHTITDLNQSLGKVGSNIESMSAITQQTAAGTDQIADIANRQVDMMGEVFKVATRLGSISQGLRVYSDRWTLPEEVDLHSFGDAASYNLREIGKKYKIKTMLFSVPLAVILFDPALVLIVGAGSSPAAWLMGALCVGGFAAFMPTLIATSMNVNKIIMPIGILGQHAEKVANGDMTADLQPDERLGRLEIMREGFNNLVDALRSSVAGTLNSCTELHEQAAEAVEGATQTAQSAQMVAATLGEIANGAASQAMEISGISEELHKIVESLRILMNGAQTLENNSEGARQLIEQGVKTAAGKKAVVTSSMEAMTKVFGV
ncbi:MAG: methyl-accepting chemotaxis protein, partial [Ignavibacteriales bacterium]